MKILTQAQAESIVEAATVRLAIYVRENGLKAMINGISGGIDSAVVAVISQKAQRLLASEGYQVLNKYVYLDVDSAPFDYERAIALAQGFKFPLEVVNLTQWYEASPLHDMPVLAQMEQTAKPARVARGNMKCRLRMITLTMLAQLFGGIYLDTDDLSEELMGFWTRHGDEGDVKIIQHFTKQEVYDLGEYLGVPAIILNSVPGDGLKVTQTSAASDQLGLTYLEIDYVMSTFIQNGLDTNGLIRQLDTHEFKTVADLVANDIQQPAEKVDAVLRQCLRTAFKRRYGDPVAHLLPSRAEFGLPSMGTDEFNSLYLAVIQAAIPA